MLLDLKPRNPESDALYSSLSFGLAAEALRFKISYILK
jgi:hypothetical protein